MSMQRNGSASEPEPVVAALGRFSQAFSSQAMETLLRLDLTIPQARALKAINRLGRASGRQLARELKVTPASVVPLCDRLEEQGYVERVRDIADRRICYFQLTPAGMEALGQRARVHARIMPVLANLSPGDRDCLARVLNALAAAIEAAMETKEGSAEGGKNGTAVCP